MFWELFKYTSANSEKHNFLKQNVSEQDQLVGQNLRNTIFFGRFILRHICALLLITFDHEGGYVFASVCLSAGLRDTFSSDFHKTLYRIVDECYAKNKFICEVDLILKMADWQPFWISVIIYCIWTMCNTETPPSECQ